ncbi:PilZ domain-containing protein [bacterium]|nr:PilZ domain-containing protein [bacterium]
MTLERREFERVEFTVTANYKVYLQKTLKKEELFYGVADLVNISAGGIQVVLKDVPSDLLQDLLDNDRKLLMAFDITVRDATTTIWGKMVWASEDRTTHAGICFVDMDVEAQKNILDYIETYQNQM